MNDMDKPLVWLHGEVQTPPFSASARVEAGFLLRQLQMGQSPNMPHSKPMPAIGRRCHELRVKDGDAEWRIVYRLDEDAIVIVEVFAKKTRKTPTKLLEVCRVRLRRYDDEG